MSNEVTFEELRKSLEEEGYNEDDIKKFKSLMDDFARIIDTYYCPSGVPVRLGLGALGVFLGTVLVKLPYSREALATLNIMVGILVDALNTMNYANALTEGDSEGAH